MIIEMVWRKGCKGLFVLGETVGGTGLACIASVSVGFGSKERPRNGVLDVLSTRKMGREPRKSAKRRKSRSSDFLCSLTPRKRLLRRLEEAMKL